MSLGRDRHADEGREVGLPFEEAHDDGGSTILVNAVDHPLPHLHLIHTRITGERAERGERGERGERERERESLCCAWSEVVSRKEERNKEKKKESI